MTALVGEAGTFTEQSENWRKGLTGRAEWTWEDVLEGMVCSEVHRGCVVGQCCLKKRFLGIKNLKTLSVGFWKLITVFEQEGVH